MYRHGHDLPEFAMYPLLDTPAAMADLTAMYRAVLEVAAKHGMNAMICGLDYRASPDWAAKLGYSRAALETALERAIGFLHEVAAPYRDRIGDILIGGMIGPRGDAYESDAAMSAVEAEAYHGFQIDVLKRLEVDFVHAVTFGDVADSGGRGARRRPRRRSGRDLLHAGRGPAAEIGTDAQGSDYRGRRLRRGRPGPTSTASTARTRWSSKRRWSRPTWVHRLRSLRPNASAKDKMELCQLGHGWRKATRSILASVWARWRGASRISTCGAAAVEPGTSIWTRSRATSPRARPSKIRRPGVMRSRPRSPRCGAAP